MDAPVQHVETRYRQAVVLPFDRGQPLPELLAIGHRGGPGERHGSPKYRVGTKAPLVRGSIEVNERMVQCGERIKGSTRHKLTNLRVAVTDGLQHALPGVAIKISIP